MSEGLYRKRRVFRVPEPQQIFYGGIVVTAGLASGAITFGGTATAEPVGIEDGGTASGAIEFGGGPITTISIEVSGANSISFGGQAAGFGFKTSPAAAQIQFAGTARADPFAVGTLRFAGTATAASGVFTSEVAAAIVFGGASPSGVLRPGTATGSITFGGIVTGDVEGAIYTGEAASEITFSGTATGENTARFGYASGSITFGGTAIAPLYGDVDRIVIKARPYGRIRIFAA